MMNAAHRARSKSPFRRARSKSPGNHRYGRRGLSPFQSPFRRRESNYGDALQESEINVLQQLNLNRNDESAAIEITLEDSENLVPHTDLPDLYMVSSASSDPSSRAPSRETRQSRGASTARGSSGTARGSSATARGSTSDSRGSSGSERKIPFFQRIFKSPKKQTVDELTKFPTGLGSGLLKDRTSVKAKFPSSPTLSPPSRVSRSREPVAMKPPPLPVPISDRVLSDRIDNFSSMSSISDSYMPSLGPPVNLNRQESLGMESIKDVRKALKEMEKQLGRATNSGERVSRQRVMRALFTVADSLEDVEERTFLRNQLEGMMRKERVVDPGDQNPLSVASSSDDDKSDMTTSDDDEDYTESHFTASQAPSSHPSYDKENTPAGFLNSVGRLLGMSNEEKTAVEQALDDLLWTEFVKARKAPATRVRGSKSQRSKESNAIHEYQAIVGAKRPTDICHIPLGASQRVLLGEIPRDHSIPIHRERSWWRNHPIEEEEEEYDDDGESFSSDEFPSYLPTSITVRKPNRRKQNEGSFAPPLTNPRYKVKMVDTESRCGYEMGSTTSSFRR